MNWFNSDEKKFCEVDEYSGSLHQFGTVVGLARTRFLYVICFCRGNTRQERMLDYASGYSDVLR